MESLPLAWAIDALKISCPGMEVEGAEGGLKGHFTGICTDTRLSIAPGSLFVALQGEHSDGHRYLAQAFEHGAIAAVVSHRPQTPDPGPPYLIVPDTLAALGDLATAYRRRFDLPVVGITGSVGKTSTKEMTAAVLRAYGSTLASEKNFNNEIGVPLTLFQLSREHRWAVIEMGMRGLGEIDRLAEIAQPAIGAVTNIGYAHFERLGSQERIAQAKSELYARLPQGGIAILPCEDDFFEALRARVPTGCRVLTWATRPGLDADILMETRGEVKKEARPEAVAPDRAHSNVCHATVHGQVYRLCLAEPGAHQARNAAVALAVAVALELPLPPAIEALEQWRGAEGRMEIRLLPNGATVLDDCYNAGVESMAAALEVLQAYNAAGTVAVLGDIKELGDFAPEAHRSVGRLAGSKPLRLLVTVGDLGLIFGEAAIQTAQEVGLPVPERRHYPNAGAAATEITSLVKPGETVLVKGSRAMRMEQIVAALTGEPERDAHG